MQRNIPPLPEGFVLVPQQSAPQEVTPPLPPGFEMVQPQTEPQEFTPGPIPEGYVLDPKTGAMVNTKAVAERMNKGAMGQIEAFGGSAAQGLPGGTYLDEAIGALGGPVRQEVARQRVKLFDKNNPGTAIAGKVAAGASAIVPMAMSGYSFASGAQSLPKLAKGLGTDSAILGALFKSGNSEGDLEDRSKAGLEGFIEGGLTGVALPFAFRGLGTVAKPAWDALKMAFAAPAHLAQSRVADVMKQFNLTPTQVNAAVKELGPEGMVVDALGEGGKRLAKAAINRSPTAGDALLNATNKRMAGQPERVVDALMKAGGLNSPKTPNQVVEALVKKSRPEISAAYNVAKCS